MKINSNNIFLVLTIISIILLSIFQVGAIEDNPSENGDIIDDFESDFRWVVNYGEITITQKSDTSNRKNNEYMSIHFNENQDAVMIKNPTHFDFSQLDGISVDYYVPIPNEKYFFTVIIYESNGAQYDRTFKLERNGWTKVPLYFSNFEEGETSIGDDNLKLDLDKIDMISFFIGGYDGNIIPANYEINIDNLKGIVSTDVEMNPKNEYQLISQGSGAPRFVDDYGNFVEGCQLFDKYGAPVFSVGSCDKFLGVDNGWSWSSGNEIKSYDMDGTFNLSHYYTVDNLDKKHTIIDASKNGEYVVAESYTPGGSANQNELILLRGESAKKLIGEFDQNSVSLSPNNEYILVSYGIYSVDNIPKLRLYNNKGGLIWEKDKRGCCFTKKMSDNKIILSVYNTIEIYDLDFNLISKKAVYENNGNYYYRNTLIDSNIGLNSLGFSSLSNISAISIDNDILFLNDDEIISKIGINAPLSSISISPNGKYVIGVDQKWESFSELPVWHLFTNDDLVTPIFPKDGISVDTNNLSFEWDDRGALRYQIRIDNETYETNEAYFQPSDSIDLGSHEWAVKPIFENKEGHWSTPIKFYLVENDENVILQIEEVQKSTNINIIAIGAILLAILGTILMKPISKRYLLKKKLLKTHTDWCPNCHKFTGGVKICPHCGTKVAEELDLKYDKFDKTKKSDDK